MPAATDGKNTDRLKEFKNKGKGVDVSYSSTLYSTVYILFVNCLTPGFPTFFSKGLVVFK